MNNNAMMMLLPFLLSSKKSAGTGGISPEMLMGLMSGQTNGNSMMRMMLSMLSANGNPAQKKEMKPVDVEGIFGKDVQKMLRVFIAMNAKGE